MFKIIKQYINAPIHNTIYESFISVIAMLSINENQLYPVLVSEYSDIILRRCPSVLLALFLAISDGKDIVLLGIDALLRRIVMDFSRNRTSSLLTTTMESSILVNLCLRDVVVELSG